jgi:hypothetical protein
LASSIRIIAELDKCRFAVASCHYLFRCDGALALLQKGSRNKNPDRANDRGFLLPLGPLPYQSLGKASAMMMFKSPALDQKSAFSSARLQCSLTLTIDVGELLVTALWVVIVITGIAMAKFVR